MKSLLHEVAGWFFVITGSIVFFISPIALIWYAFHEEFLGVIFWLLVFFTIFHIFDRIR